MFFSIKLINIFSILLVIILFINNEVDNHQLCFKDPFQERLVSSSNHSASLSTNKVNHSVAFSIYRQETVSVISLINLNNIKQIIAFKTLLYFLFFSSISKRISEFYFLISVTRLQYFIKEIKLFILASRSHPPTFSF